MRSGGDFWRGKRVLLTGHTGFKGGWLALWLQRLGAQVSGVALAPGFTPGEFSYTATVGADATEVAIMPTAMSAMVLSSVSPERCESRWRSTTRRASDTDQR